MRYKEFSVNENYMSLLRGLIGSGPQGLDMVAQGTADPEQSADGTPQQSADGTPMPQQGNAPGGMPVSGTVTSPFGSRGGTHNGTDIAVPVGTPIQAPQDGVVSRTGSDNMNGNFVVVKTGNEENLFLHLSKIGVSNGQQVKKGQVIGLSGNTGKSTGPHLHWEKHVSGRPVDPMRNVG